MAFRSVISAILAGAILLLCGPAGFSAAGGKELKRVSGTVGYKADRKSAFVQLGGAQVLGDNTLAVTQARSTGQVTLEDSSVVGLGQNTQVVLGAFNNAVQGPGSTITVDGGALRFEVHRAGGGRANYTFTTPSSSIAVRGTIGLIRIAPNGDETIVCLACNPNDVVVTVGTQTYALLTGQMLAISHGVVTPGTETQDVANSFTNDGLNASVGGEGGTFTAFNSIRPIGNVPGAILTGIGVLTGTILNSQTTNPPKPPPQTPGGNIILQSHPAPTPTPPH